MSQSMLETPAPGAPAAEARAPARRRSRMPHAIVMMLLIQVGAVALTYVVPSGAFQRGPRNLVVPGSYTPIPKDYAPGDVLAGRPSAPKAAYPASPAAVFTSIPKGMVAAAPLIFMILFIGGMFGVLRRTGALDAGVERLLALTRGNLFLLAPILMLALSLGSTFLGLISEYLVAIPLVVLVAERLGYSALIGTAIVAVAAKVGYMTSVTNPLALVVAQPIVGVPVFSGAGFRFAFYLVAIAVGIAYVLRAARRSGRVAQPELVLSGERLSPRHLAVLGVLLVLVAAIVVGARERDWGNPELGALYIAAAFVIALLGRLPGREAAEAFLDGMKTMVLAGLLVGLARAVEVILKDGLILDTVIQGLAGAAEGRHPILVAQLMEGIDMALGVLIPSTSGKAAVSMPILGPIAHLAGVGPQTAVLAFVFGNGLCNMITPTSGMLLAYLATGRVAYGEWIRFVLPLFAILTLLSLAAISVAVLIGL